jgi:ABC-type transport system involved in multi-copper enzyme maturation permease subunit
MRRWSVQRALLAKEWQHNRGYFWITAVLLVYVPVLKSLYYLLRGGDAAREWVKQLVYILNFHQMVMGPPPVSQDTMHILGVAVAILLGAILLGEERKGSLTYLLTTPVARREIVLTKFLFGTGTLLVAMGINFLFLSAMSGPLGLDLSLMTLIRWGLIMSLSLIGLFTLSLFVSTFTSGTMPAAGLSFLLIYLPGMLVAMLENTAARYFHVSELFSIKAQYVQGYLTFTDYITGEHWSIVHHVEHLPGWRTTGVSWSSGPPPHLGLESGVLLLGIVILLGLSILIFEHLSLDEQGAFFASHRPRQVFIILCALLAGYLLIFPYCTTLPIFLGWLFVMIIAVFGLFEWLPKKLKR